MGMFDSVYFTCPTPKCKNRIEVQSKAGECILETFDEDYVPYEIAKDIKGDPAYCPVCKKHFRVVDDSDFANVRMKLE